MENKKVVRAEAAEVAPVLEEQVVEVTETHAVNVDELESKIVLRLGAINGLHEIIVFEDINIASHEEKIKALKAARQNYEAELHEMAIANRREYQNKLISQRDSRIKALATVWGYEWRDYKLYKIKDFKTIDDLEWEQQMVEPGLNGGVL